MNAKRWAWVCAALLLGAASAGAQAGKSDTEKFGKVSFPTSCRPEVQPVFEHGVQLLHSFWWDEGLKTFKEVMEKDPDCAIAAWGLAAILIGNTLSPGDTRPDEAKVAKEALAHVRAIGAKTQRERDYIEGISAYYDNYPGPKAARIQALATAFERVAQRNPGDDEAQIFHALYVSSSQSLGDKTYASALKAAEILEVQFKKHPDHPGVAHYLIHSYDYPPIAMKGQDAARRYAEIAPSAPHALHMPSHIFTRIGDWRDSAATNLRAADAAKKGKEFHEQLHTMDYMAYAYLQMAWDKEAARVAAQAPQVTGLVAGRPAGYYAQAAIPARVAVERGAWKEAAALEPERSPYPFTTAMTHFARALGAARSGDVAAAEKDVQEILRIRDELKAAKNDYWATEVEVNRLNAAAWIAFAKGDRAGALQQQRTAADLEDGSDKNVVTPGRIVPARELLGDMLLEAGQTNEALAEYERSAVREPNRFRGTYGAAVAAARAGNKDKARFYFAKLVNAAGSGDPRPELQQASTYLASK